MNFKMILPILLVFLLGVTGSAVASEATTQPWSPEAKTLPVTPAQVEAEVEVDTSGLQNSIDLLRSAVRENRQTKRHMDSVKKSKKKNRKRGDKKNHKRSGKKHL